MHGKTVKRVFVCFVWISEQTAIISPYSIKVLIFNTETECVYCAVGAKYLVVSRVNLSRKGLHTRI